MEPGAQTTAGSASRPAAGVPVISVVLPCLDEAGSVGQVVSDALRVAAEAGLDAEVIVADNGSTDGSAEVAAAAGARVAPAPQRGYGNAYHAGVAAARGRVLVMADADGTYPMEAIPELVAPILAGDLDLVIGSRLRGSIATGAMPWTHRRVGTPLLTGMLNRMCGAMVTDAHSGMRAIDRAAYGTLNLAAPGMEYASEMIVNATRSRLRIGERPIAYRVRAGDSKLHPVPDAWRHVKLLLLASPTWLFLGPGIVLFLAGAALVVPLAFGPVSVGPVELVLHPMFFGSALVIVGFEIAEFGLLARACSPLVGRGDRLGVWLRTRLSIEKALAASGLAFGAGAAVGIGIFVRWALNGFAHLGALRLALVALTLCVLGIQILFGAFLYAFFLPAAFAGGVTSPSVGLAVARPAAR
ncbi:MAG: glycosyltransferase family 2 protein [Actinomycetota bacterium]|nr:glycosyltransferase family 2 protein [Actinomycetota bacterium]